MAISPAVDREPTVAIAESEPSARSDAPKYRLVLLGVLVLALLTTVVVVVWLLADRRGAADDVQAQREDVMSQTEQFVLRLNTYSPDQLDKSGHLAAYRKQVLGVITPKFGSDFESSGLPLAEQTVAKAGYARSAKVFGVGVQSLDADTATVIVAAGLSSSYPDPKHPNNAAKRIRSDTEVLRWEVDLVRTGGQWLVDDYSPVTGQTSGGAR